MLLQIENTSGENIAKLIAYAKELNLRLSVIDDKGNDSYLPGQPLTDEQLTQLIENSRKSGIISMENAHHFIRDNYRADH